MTLFLSFLFLLISYTNACCVHQSKVALSSNYTAISGGACGYGFSVTSYYGSHLAASIPSLYKDGVGCGACFQVRCKDKKVCTKQGTRVIVTDVKHVDKTDFVLSNRAFRSMANKGMDKAILKLGVVDVEYKRVSCQYKSHNFSIRVEESSKKPNHLTVKFLYQGGKTEILSAAVAQVGSSNWDYLTRNNGAVWNTSNAPTGPLKFEITVIGGFDAARYYPEIPADWKVGVIYETTVQINDISLMFGCDPSCQDENWN